MAGDYVFGPDFAKQLAVRELQVTAFDRWVGDNNIDSAYEYGKGWWDYVETIRRLAFKFDVADVRVVGHYVIDTPPPEEKLPMPVVAMSRGGVDIVLKWDFGAACRWPFEWTVSVRRPSPYLGPIFGLFDPSCDLRHAGVGGLGPWLFGSYRNDPAAFTCELRDEWDLASLVRLVLFEI